MPPAGLCRVEPEMGSINLRFQISEGDGMGRFGQGDLRIKISEGAGLMNFRFQISKYQIHFRTRPMNLKFQISDFKGGEGSRAGRGKNAELGEVWARGRRLP